MIFSSGIQADADWEWAECSDMTVDDDAGFAQQRLGGGLHAGGWAALEF
jgi:hypothetical protein